MTIQPSALYTRNSIPMREKEVKHLQIFLYRGLPAVAFMYDWASGGSASGAGGIGDKFIPFFGSLTDLLLTFILISAIALAGIGVIMLFFSKRPTPEQKSHIVYLFVASGIAFAVFTLVLIAARFGMSIGSPNASIPLPTGHGNTPVFE